MNFNLLASLFRLTPLALPTFLAMVFTSTLLAPIHLALSAAEGE